MRLYFSLARHYIGKSRFTLTERCSAWRPISAANFRISLT
jgi:hypothetical protein